MEINQKEALTILSSLGDEDGGITEEEIKLKKRIREEFPAIDEAMKKSERREYLWEHEVEDDKRVREAREKLDKHAANHEKDFGIIIKEFMNLKLKVLRELLEKKEVDQ